MAGEVNWLPKQPNRFIFSGSELKLYELPELSATDTKDGKKRPMEDFLLHAESNFRFVKCIDVGYHESESVVAVGLTTGRLAAINFDAPARTVEFISKNPKTLNCLRWKGTESRVAVGIDRSKSDDCVTLWDTEKNTLTMGFGGSDSAISMSWDVDFKCLLVGVASKYLKLYDPRVGTKDVLSAVTKSIQGVEFVNLETYYFSSFADNSISYFDVRAFDRPIVQVTTNKTVTKTAWCRSKRKLGAVLCDSSLLHIFDLHWPTNDPEAYYTSRRYSPYGAEKAPLVDLSWNSKDSERLILLNAAGNIQNYQIEHDLKVQFDSRGNFMMIDGQDLKQYRTQYKGKGKESYLDEVSEIMQQRALKDYGLIADIQQNGEVAHSQTLLEVWKVLASMYSKGWMQGLISILGVSSSIDGGMATRSEIQYLDWCDFPSFTPLKTFRSESRQLSQALCGWNFEKNSDTSFNKFLDSLVHAHEYTKAALIACFHLKLKQAVEVLTRSGDSVHRITAIAIGSFNSDRNFLRSDMTNLYADITDPYLRAIFAFLSQVDDHWEGILKEKKLPLTDRMAFACMYLSDSQLGDYIKKQITLCIEMGDLTGILLTGTTGEGVGLLQSYLDSSEDIQTVSLIASRFFANEQTSNPLIQYWISTYRGLLDTWGFWELRAQFDIMMGNRTIPPKSIYLLCNFCGKSISSALHEDPRMRSSKIIDRQCPHCRKPLPRCSLCLMHMGTPTSTAIQSASKTRSSDTQFQSKPFSSWFAWCQTCRHGGHTEHLNAWFAQYSECPVTSCDCNCYELDQPMPVMKKD